MIPRGATLPLALALTDQPVRVPARDTPLPLVR